MKIMKMDSKYGFIINELYLIREDYIDYGMKDRVEVIEWLINLVVKMYKEELEKND